MDNDKDTIKAILDYWFTDDPEYDRHTDVKDGLFKLWYMGGEQVDNELREKFGESLEKAASG